MVNNTNNTDNGSNFDFDPEKNPKNNLENNNLDSSKLNGDLNEDLEDDLDDEEEFFEGEFEGFEEYYSELSHEENMKDAEMFEDLLEKYFDENGECTSGTMISSDTIEKNSITYNREIWEVDGIKITKVVIDRTIQEDIQDEEDKNKYVSYLKMSLIQIQEDLDNAIINEDYEKAADLKNRIGMINKYIKFNSKK